jgi:hypothetical protein
MYHMRAAMSIIPRPIYLYDCPNVPNDIMEYLKAIAKAKKVPYLFTSWTRAAILNAGDRPPIANQKCVLGVSGQNFSSETIVDLTTAGDISNRMLGFITEGYATERFTTELNLQPQKLDIVKASMTMVDGHEEVLQKMFSEINPFAKWPKPTEAKPTVLVLHRDSGKTVGGPYPEYDSGAALEQIVKVINAQSNSKGTARLMAVVSGAVKSTPTMPSIETYWLQLKPVEGVTKRDIEAYFLKWAYNQGWFQMAVGFRSGGLDLFTLMGIPTISIGLRHLIGEDRHEMLAAPMFMRVNVQYDRPRHFTTAWIRGKNDGPNCIHSPYWLWQAPLAITTTPRPAAPTEAQKIDWQGRETGPFQPFDLWTFEVGLRVACERNFSGHGWGITLSHFVPFNGCVVTTRQGRYAYPAEIKLEELKKFFSDLSAVDHKDIDARRVLDVKAQLQETDTDFKRYLEDAEAQWNFIESVLSDDALDNLGLDD